MTNVRSNFVAKSMSRGLPLLCLVFVFMAMGCAGSQKAYMGPERPASEVALVTIGEHSLTNWMAIAKVNNQTFTPTLFTPILNETQVLPGPTEIVVIYWDAVSHFPFLFVTQRSYPLTATFTAEAGHAYEFEGEGGWSETPIPIKVRLIDSTTGDTVWQDETDASKPSVTRHVVP